MLSDRSKGKTWIPGHPASGAVPVRSDRGVFNDDPTPTVEPDSYSDLPLGKGSPDWEQLADRNDSMRRRRRLVRLGSVAAVTGTAAAIVFAGLHSGGDTGRMPSASAAHTHAGDGRRKQSSLQPAHVPYYVVPATDQVYLYQLAQLVLGNGDDYTQIVALNRGRAQPDGSSLIDPSMIDTGWLLVLPCDAKGSDFGVAVAWNPPPGLVPPSEVHETCAAGE